MASIACIAPAITRDLTQLDGLNYLTHAALGTVLDAGAHVRLEVDSNGYIKELETMSQPGALREDG
jgi:hypothetical protein